MNPRQSRLGVPSVTHLVTAFNLRIDCYMVEEGVGTASRLTVQRILRVDHVEPFAPARFWDHFLNRANYGKTKLFF